MQVLQIQMRLSLKNVALKQTEAEDQGSRWRPKNERSVEKNKKEDLKKNLSKN